MDKPLYKFDDPNLLALRQHATAIAADLDQRIRDILSPPALPSVIYHYAKTESAKAIIKSGVFWMADYREVNDGTEFQHGREIFEETLQKHPLLSKHHLQERLIPIIAEGMELYHRPNIYISSFSTVGDLKSQWVEYADNCKGCAIGYDANTISREITNGMIVAVGESGGLAAQVFIAPTVYEDSLKKSRISECLDVWLPPIVEAFEEKLLFGPVRLALLAGFSGGMYRAIATLKHPSCFEEREVRIVVCIISTDATQKAGMPAFRKPYESNSRQYFHLVRLRSDWKSILSLPSILAGRPSLSAEQHAFQPIEICFGARMPSTTRDELQRYCQEILAIQPKFMESTLPYKNSM